MKKNLLFYRNSGIRIFSSFTTIVLVLSSIIAHAQPNFSKSFNSDQIGPGSVSTLTFTIDNSGSGEGATDLDFTDVLPAGVTIATPANASVSEVTGTLDAPDGGTTISYSGGRCGVRSTLTITVDVTSSTPGTHTNVTGDLTSSLGNSGTATDDLIVTTDRPGFSKSFSPSTINFGERSTLTFVIDNTANSSGVANIDFTDNLPDGMVVADPANTSISYVGGTPFQEFLTAVPGSSEITYDANGVGFLGFYALEAGATITISVDVYGNSAGSLNNVTELLADFTSCGKASATLEVLTPTQIFIQKSFTTNPVVPGGTTNLEFTISNYSRTSDATNVSFTDDLNAVLSGLAASGTPLNDICGGGSQLSGTSELTLTGGTVPAGSSKTFSVPISIPANAAIGEYTNTTSEITASSMDGRTIAGNTATEKLFVAAAVPTISKKFLDNPIAPGSTVKLEFTITNTDPVNSLTDINFTDNLTDFLGFFPPTISNMPADGSFGGGSTFREVSLGFNELGFELTGGSLAPGASHSFTIDIDIPTGFPGGTYTNTTSELSAEVDGETVAGNPASDDLEIIKLPRLSKSFTDDPVLAGDTATLEFTITYNDEGVSENVTDISFTDDLDAVIPGLAAVGLPLNDVCGTGSVLSGTSTITLAGGNMVPGDTYTFSVPVVIPATALPGSYTNTTSELSATVDGLSGTSSAASDNLEIGGLTFTKEFIDDPALPGDLVTLRFTIDNETIYEATGISFTDNLSNVISGLVAEGPLPTSICGSGASLFGTSFLFYSDGVVNAGTSCIFDVLCRMPANTESSTYNNVTSNLTALINGSPITISPAYDNLVVNNNLIALSKTFTDDPVVPGNTATVEYTLTNLDPARTISNINFTDDLDLALSGLVATGLPSASCGGTVSGTSTIDFSGGSLAAGESCTFSVTLQTPASAPFGGSRTSTTSSLTGEINGFPVVGDPASDNLEFTPLIVSKAFETKPISAGESVTLTFTLTNSDPANQISNISFTDDLNNFISGAIATNLPLDNVCGERSSVAGTSIFSFNGGNLAPNETKSFDVTVQIPCGTTPGDYLNTTSTITAGRGISFSTNPATANLTIVDDFTPGAIATTGETICYGGDPSVIGNETAASGGDETITYKWQKSTSSESSDFSDIPSSNSATYNPPSGLTETTWFQRLAKDGTCNTEFSVSAGIWKVSLEETPPIANCKDITVHLDGSGSASLDSLAVDDGSSDNCSIATHELDISSFDCNDVGNNPVIMTVTDASGNSNQCTATVTVKDTISPIAACKDITVHLDGSGSASLDSLAVDNDSQDNCNIASHELDISSFDCGDLGNQTVTMTVTDTNGNSSACTAIVTVEDSTPPAITCSPIEIILHENGEYVLAPQEIRKMAEGTTDACTSFDEIEIDVFPRSFECLYAGYDVQVVVSATDKSGNTSTCQTFVSVLDTVSPVAICEDVTVALDENGEALIFPGQINAGNNDGSLPEWARTLNDLNDGSYDACGIEIASLNKQQFDCTDLGENSIKLTVVDPSGNTSTCTSKVTIKDNIPPEFEPVTAIEIELEPGECSAIIDYPELQVTDNCEVTLTQIAGLGPDGMFPIGTTTEKWMATDASGNFSDTVTFEVNLTTTNAPPTLDDIADVEVAEDAGEIIIDITGISDGGDCDEEDVSVLAEITSGTDVVSLDSVMYTAGNDSAKLVLKTNPDMNGDAKISVSVIDAAGDTIAKTMTLTVIPVNDSPFLVNPVADQVVNASYKLAVSVSSVLGEYFDDIDNETLTFVATIEDGSSLPDWATITGDSLVATPSIADIGCVNIVVQASDGKYSASDTFSVCVEGYPTSITDLENGLFEVTLYPNPTQGHVNVDIESSTLSDVELTVLDITGKEVLRKQYRAAERITFDMSGKVSGIYFVKLDFEGKQVLKKLIVNRK